VVSWLIFTSQLVFSTHNGDTPQNHLFRPSYESAVLNHSSLSLSLSLKLCHDASHLCGFCTCNTVQIMDNVVQKWTFRMCVCVCLCLVESQQGTCIFCRVPEHGSCHSMSRRMKAFKAIKLPCSVTRWKVHLWLNTNVMLKAYNRIPDINCANFQSFSSIIFFPSWLMKTAYVVTALNFIRSSAFCVLTLSCVLADGLLNFWKNFQIFSTFKM